MLLLSAVTALNGRGGREVGRGGSVSTTPRHRGSIHHTDSSDYYYSASNAYLRVPFTKIRIWGLENGFVKAHNSFSYI